jgi:hypothetical protein
VTHGLRTPVRNVYGLGLLRIEQIQPCMVVLQCQEEWVDVLTPVEWTVPFDQKGTGKHAKCATRNQNVKPTQVRKLVQSVDHVIKTWSQHKYGNLCKAWTTESNRGANTRCLNGHASQR